MADSAVDDTELTCQSLLRIIASANPPPWHARDYLRIHSPDRQKLDELLTELRMSGIIQLTDWQKQTGQGYRVTPYGNEILSNPVMLERLKGPFEPQPIRLPASPPERAVPWETTLDRGDRARSALTVPRKSLATNLLIAVNLLVSLLCVAQCVRSGTPVGHFLLGGDGEIVEQMGGLSSLEIARNHWGRLISYGFVHFGAIHLAMNMLALRALGPFLETGWGSGRFLIIYMMSILGGGIVSLVVDPGTATSIPVVAGASGGVWGLLISAFVWIAGNRRHIPRPMFAATMQSLMTALILNLAISFLPHVSMTGHLGGGAVGGITAALLFMHWHYSPPWKALAFALLAALPIFGVFLVLHEMHNSADWRMIVDVAKAP